MNGLIANDTFTLADLPPVRKAIPGRWVHKWRVNQHNKVVRANIRLHIKGAMQEQRVGYFDTYASTLSNSSFRLLTGVAAGNRIKLSHFDIQQAFIQALPMKEVCMKLPPGCGESAGKTVDLNKLL